MLTISRHVTTQGQSETRRIHALFQSGDEDYEGCVVVTKRTPAVPETISKRLPRTKEPGYSGFPGKPGMAPTMSQQMKSSEFVSSAVLTRARCAGD
jgi:hypothetical protein